MQCCNFLLDFNFIVFELILIHIYLLLSHLIIMIYFEPIHKCVILYIYRFISESFYMYIDL